MEINRSQVQATAPGHSPPPSLRFEKCFPCPCGGGSCPLLTSKSKYAGRKFYVCPLSDSEKCRFFKWADSVQPNEYIDVPYCGGCMAGLCRFTQLNSGPNRGRVLFACKIKESPQGQGSCGFKVWKDELERLNPVPKTVNSLQSSSINFNNAGPSNTASVLGFNLIEEEPTNKSRMNGNSNNGAMHRKMEQFKFQEEKSDKLSKVSPEGLQDGNQKGLASRLDSKCLEQEETILTETHRQPLFVRGYNSENSGSKPSGFDLEEPLNGKPFPETRLDNAIAETISKSFRLAAGHLQNDLVTRLAAMTFEDHKSMSQAAEATFAALDRLLYDYRPLKEHVNELIHRAISVTEIEQPVQHDDSYQKMADHCFSERTKLDEMERAHVQAVESVNNSRKHLNSLQIELSAVKNWLLGAEAEFRCCMAEMRNMEHKLEQISGDKEILWQNVLLSSKEWEDASKFHEQREGDRNAAKAAFEKAKSSLRAYNRTEFSS